MSKVYLGENEARSSIDWLNRNATTTHGNAVFERVENILANLKALAPLTGKPGKVDESALQSLRSSLEQYKLYPSVDFDPSGILHLTFYDEDDPLSSVFGEGFNVVLNLYHLAQMGVVESISRCPICSRWFFSKLPQHTCCTRECRKVFEKTPEQKRLRNERLKRNRRIEKERDSRFKKAIEYSKPKARSKRGSK